jgi:hypothetical protein
MFSFLKANPAKKLEQRYAQKLEEAMQAQRNGDIRKYSELTEQADAIHKEIQALVTETQQ